MKTFAALLIAALSLVAEIHGAQDTLVRPSIAVPASRTDSLAQAAPAIEAPELSVQQKEALQERREAKREALLARFQKKQELREQRQEERRQAAENRREEKRQRKERK